MAMNALDADEDGEVEEEIEQYHDQIDALRSLQEVVNQYRDIPD